MSGLCADLAGVCVFRARWIGYTEGLAKVGCTLYHACPGIYEWGKLKTQSLIHYISEPCFVDVEERRRRKRRMRRKRRREEEESHQPLLLQQPLQRHLGIMCRRPDFVRFLRRPVCQLRHLPIYGSRYIYHTLSLSRSLSVYCSDALTDIGVVSDGPILRHTMVTHYIPAWHI